MSDEALIENIRRAIQDEMNRSGPFASHAVARAILPIIRRHRLAERAAIVAWLRDQGEVHRSVYAVSIDPHIMQLASAIEAGEHLK